jgi:hypothetical protein
MVAKEEFNIWRFVKLRSHILSILSGTNYSGQHTANGTAKAEYAIDAEIDVTWGYTDVRYVKRDHRKLLFLVETPHFSKVDL